MEKDLKVGERDGEAVQFHLEVAVRPLNKLRVRDMDEVVYISRSPKDCNKTNCSQETNRNVRINVSRQETFGVYDDCQQYWAPRRLYKWRKYGG